MSKKNVKNKNRSENRILEFNQILDLLISQHPKSEN